MLFPVFEGAEIQHDEASNVEAIIQKYDGQTIELLDRK